MDSLNAVVRLNAARSSDASELLLRDAAAACLAPTCLTGGPITTRSDISRPATDTQEVHLH